MVGYKINCRDGGFVYVSKCVRNSGMVECIEKEMAVFIPVTVNGKGEGAFWAKKVSFATTLQFYPQ